MARRYRGRRNTPPFPGNIFYGKVKGAEECDVVMAVVLGETVATDEVDDKLEYWIDVPTENAGLYRGRRVLMPPRYGGLKGDTVEFYLDGVLVGEATFNYWTLTNLDLDMKYES